VLEVEASWVALPPGEVKPVAECPNDCSKKGVCVRPDVTEGIVRADGRDDQDEAVCKCDGLQKGFDCSEVATPPILKLCEASCTTLDADGKAVDGEMLSSLPLELSDAAISVNLALIAEGTDGLSSALPAATFVARSLDETLLPSSHMQLASAQSMAGIPILELTIRRPATTPPRPVNVSVSVAGSVDGVLFGSGDLLVQLTPTVPPPNGSDCLQPSDLPIGCEAVQNRRCSCQYAWADGCPGPQAVELFCA